MRNFINITDIVLKKLCLVPYSFIYNKIIGSYESTDFMDSHSLSLQVQGADSERAVGDKRSI
jgi:hypothetical protein